MTKVISIDCFLPSKKGTTTPATPTTPDESQEIVGEKLTPSERVFADGREQWVEHE